MLSGVLNSERVIQVNIAIMRVFVLIREFVASHKELAAKLDELEAYMKEHDEQAHRGKGFTGRFSASKYESFV